MKRLTIFIFGLLVSSRSNIAQAEPSQTEKADLLFREGREAMKRMDYSSACNKFRASQKLDPAPGTTLSIAECEEALDQLASAHQHYSEVLAQVPETDERAKLAQKQRFMLEKKMGRVIFDPASKQKVSRFELYKDASREEKAPLSLIDPFSAWVAPGTYHVSIFSEGKSMKIIKSINVRAGELTRVEYRPQNKQEQVESRQVQEVVPGMRTGTKVLLIGGGAVLLGGVLWPYGAVRRENAMKLCPDYMNKGKLECIEYSKANEELKTSRVWITTGQVLAFTGGVALLTGLFMNLNSRESNRKIQIKPWGDPSTGLSGAMIGGVW
jgi:hypothetical protein